MEPDFLSLRLQNSKIAIKKSMISLIFGWKKPSTVEKLKSIIGFKNFLRRLVSGISELIKPIQRLLVITMKIKKNRQKEEPGTLIQN
jgi:hypothetical protein